MLACVDSAQAVGGRENLTNFEGEGGTGEGYGGQEKEGRLALDWGLEFDMKF